MTLRRAPAIQPPATLAASAAEDEPVWRMPLFKAYDKKLDSLAADMKNITGSRAGGTVAAALFLQRFVTSGSWAHLDIPNVAWKGPPGSPTIPEGASGFGVRLLNRLVADHYEPARRDGDTAMVAVRPADPRPLFSPVAELRVLSGPDTTAWITDPAADVGNATARRRTELLASLASACLGRSLAPRERAALGVALTDAAATAGDRVPTVPMVVEALLAPSAPAARRLRPVRRSTRLFPEWQRPSQTVP